MTAIESHPAEAGHLEALRHSEIRDTRNAFMDEDISRFDVTVNESLAVGEREPFESVQGMGHQLLRGERAAIFVVEVHERGAVTEFHHEVERALVRSAFDEPDDIRVVELAGDLHFAFEPENRFLSGGCL